MFMCELGSANEIELSLICGYKMFNLDGDGDVAVVVLMFAH